MPEIIKSPDTFGFVAAALTTIAFLPQLMKVVRTKSATDVSLSTLLLFMTGLLFWIGYGWRTHSLPILLANIITFVLNISILFFKLKLEFSAR